MRSVQHGLMTYHIIVDESYSFIQAGGGVGICSAIKTSDVTYNNCVYSYSYASSVKVQVC